MSQYDDLSTGDFLTDHIVIEKVAFKLSHLVNRGAFGDERLKCETRLYNLQKVVLTFHYVRLALGSTAVYWNRKSPRVAERASTPHLGDRC